MAADFDFSELTSLAADIGKAIPGSKKPLRQALEVNARKVKDAWREKLATVGGHAKRTRYAIDYDVTEFQGFGAATLEAEVGAPRGSGRQAGVVRLLENGSIKNPARGYGAASLHENEADLEVGVQRAIDDALKQAGL